MDKKGKQEMVGTIIAVVIVAIALQSFGVIDIQSALGGEPSITTAEAVAGACGDPSNTLTFGPVSKKWDPSTTPSTGAGSSVRYYINGGKGTASTATSTKTVRNGAEVNILHSYGSSADTTYYQQLATFVMPCAPIDSGDLSDSELLANGSITWENFNVDTGNKNAGTGADNETINTADTGRWYLAFTTLDKTGVSTPGGQYGLVVEVNKSMYDETTLTLGGQTGVQVPQSYTLSNTDSFAVMWEFPACPTGGIRSCSETLGRLQVTADSGENPTGAGAGTTNALAIGSGDLLGCIVDQSYGLHTITDDIIGPAYVDNEGTALGIFTASGQCQLITVD